MPKQAQKSAKSENSESCFLQIFQLCNLLEAITDSQTFSYSRFTYEVYVLPNANIEQTANIKINSIRSE